MGWQDFAVWGIGIVVAAVVLRRMWCFFRGTRRMRVVRQYALCAEDGMPQGPRRQRQTIARKIPG